MSPVAVPFEFELKLDVYCDESASGEPRERESCEREREDAADPVCEQESDVAALLYEDVSSLYVRDLLLSPLPSEDSESVYVPLPLPLRLSSEV